MPRATYEFSSFRALLDHRHNDVRPGTAPSSEPWLPPGTNKSHQRTRGLPSPRERESAAVAAVRSEAAAERHSVDDRLASVEDAFGRLDHRIDDLVRDYEKHVISASAAAVLLQQKLSELGVGSA